MRSSRKVVFFLVIPLLCAPRCGAQDTDPAEIRQEIARLKAEVSQRLEEIAALEARLGSGEPRLGLEGYCPVTLVNEERWLMGSPDHSTTYEGCIYQFADDERKWEFLKSPKSYVPVLQGHDPVIWMEQGKRVVGHRRHGLFFRGEILLFATEDSLERFTASPERFSDSKQTMPALAADRPYGAGRSAVGPTIDYRTDRERKCQRIHVGRRRLRRR